MYGVVNRLGNKMSAHYKKSQMNKGPYTVKMFTILIDILNIKLIKFISCLLFNVVGVVYECAMSLSI